MNTAIRNRAIGFIAVVALFVGTFFYISASYHSYEAGEAHANFTSNKSVEQSVLNIEKYAAAIAHSKAKISKPYTESKAQVAEDNTILNQRLRNALDKVGGKGIKIVVVNSPCSRDNDEACVFSLRSKTVEVSSEFAVMYSDHWMVGLFAHEMGHVIQQSMPENILYTPRYLGVFNYNLEWEADCNAYSLVGYTSSNYGYKCSPEQLRVATEMRDWYNAQQ
jgi:hypothetical protein